jgi:hypothetical protein
MSDAPRIVSIDLTHLVQAALDEERRASQTPHDEESTAALER